VPYFTLLDDGAAPWRERAGPDRSRACAASAKCRAAHREGAGRGAP